ncbi:MAG: response regulator [Deltaproteobacteria bacterium]|nr:response regulator [Deltaproteobacteria bacterium]
MIVQCKKCGTRYRIPPERLPAGKARFRCNRCRYVFIIESDQTTILVAKDNPEFRLFVKEILEERNLRVLTAENGVEALKILRRSKPALAILDVALPKIYGFELCETIKSNPKTQDIRIILIAASYRKARYKRLPESLYGADDYIEIHHIADQLIHKIGRLLPGLSLLTTEPLQGTSPATVSSSPPGPLLDDEVRNKVERLARTMLSDIALYNETRIKEGLAAEDLPERLAPELQEAEGLMKERFPDLPEATLHHFLQQELASFTAKRTAGVSV